MSRATAERNYFTHLFEQHHRALYAYAFKKCQDSFVAEEITQTTFIKFWQYQSRSNSPQQENPERLLFFIAKALLVDHYRKKTAGISIEKALAAENISDDSLTQKHESLHFTSLVRSAAGTLPDRQKQIFEMSYFQELSHGNCNGTEHLPPDRKNLLGKAMKQVRKLTAQQFLLMFTGLL